jgi:type I restriction enzyme S subunit
MSTMWRTVRLREVLIERRETPDAEALAIGSIRIVSKIGFERGRVELRQELGTQTGMILVRPGDLLLSGINAAKGAIAIYGAENSDPVAATIHYGAYSVVPEHADITYLWWYLRSNAFRESLSRSLPEGIKTELRSKRLLLLEIPLPSLAEQRRIMARIEALAAQIAEARSLRDQAAEEAEALCRSIIIADAQAIPTALSELARLRVPDVEVQAQESYQFAGVYSLGRGVFRGDSKTGLDFAYPRLTRLRAGDFVYPKLMAWEGAFGVVPKECDGCVVSTEFPVFEIDEAKVYHEILDTYFRMPSVWPGLAGASTGTNVRRRRLNPRDFLAYKLPLPSRTTQQRLRRVRTQVDALKRLQAQTAAELDALLPSVLDCAFKGEL